MATSETKNTAWIARRTLMDQVKCESVEVTNIPAALHKLKHLNDDTVMNLMEMVLDCEDDEITSSVMESILLSEEDNSIRSCGGLPITDNDKFIDFRNKYLSESSNDDDFEKNLTNAVLKGSAVSVAAVIATQLKHDSIENVTTSVKKVLRGVAKVNAKAYNNAASMPVIRKLIPGGYLGKKGDKVRAPRYNPSTGKLVSAANGKTAARHSWDTYVKGKSGKPREFLNKIEKGGPSVKKIGGRAAIAIGGITAVSALAFGVYKYISDDARNACSDQKGDAKSKCMYKHRIVACEMAIKKLQEGMSSCDDYRDPEKCKYSIRQQLYHWRTRQKKYQEKLAKLNRK